MIPAPEGDQSRVAVERQSPGSESRPTSPRKSTSRSLHYIFSLHRHGITAQVDSALIANHKLTPPALTLFCYTSSTPYRLPSVLRYLVRDGRALLCPFLSFLPPPPPHPLLSSSHYPPLPPPPPLHTLSFHHALSTPCVYGKEIGVVWL